LYKIGSLLIICKCAKFNYPEQRMLLNIPSCFLLSLTWRRMELSVCCCP